MFSNNMKVSTRQIKRLLVLEIFSTTSLILPRMTVGTADRDGIISIIIGTVFALLYGYLILSLAKKIEGNFIEYSKVAVGRFVTYIFALLYVFKILFSCVFMLQMFSKVITSVLLPLVSDKIIIAAILLICSYAASKGMEGRGRIAELLYLIALIPIIIVLVLAVPKVDITNTMPLFIASGKDILSGGYLVFIIYSAVELLLFATPYIKDVNKLHRPVSMSIITVGVLNIAIFLMTIGLFGVNGTKKMEFPVLNIMEVIRLPGGFLGRQDALMISFWVISVFAIISAYLFYLSIILKQAVKMKEQSYLVIPFAILAYFISTMISPEILGYSNYISYMKYIGVPQSIIIPFIILLIAKARGRGKDND